MSKRFRRRRGTVIIVALVCLVVVMALVAALLQGTLRARRQLHTQRDLRQTELLLEAGLARAQVRLAAEADYRGETWTLPAGGIVGTGRGQVTIEATRAAGDQPGQLHVVAEYPLGDDSSIRRSRTLTIQSQE